MDLEPPLAALLADCLAQPCIVIVACGAAADAFVVEALAHLPPDVLAIFIGDDHGRPGAVIVPRDDLPVEACVRSALRQDPDVIAVGAAPDDCIALLLQARLTGHTVIFGLPDASAETAWTQLRAAVPGEYDPAMFFPPPSLLVEVGGRALQVVEDALVPLLVRDGGVLRATGNALAVPPPYVPPPEDFSERAVPEGWPPRSEPVLDTLERKLRPYRREAWAPVLADGDDHLGSKLGGVAALLEGEPWPQCGDCGRPMWLVAQIDFARLPAAAQARLGAAGLFQFFYCTDGGCPVRAAWEPFAANRLLRVIDAGAVVPGPSPFEEKAPFRCARIEAWAPLEDSPLHEELCYHLGVELADDEHAAWYAEDDLREMSRDTERGVALRERFGAYLRHWRLGDAEVGRAAALLHTHRGDKLLGWPAWTQNVEYPACPTCQAPMDMLLQINNDGFEGGEAGDRSFFGQLFAVDGNGHVFGCKTHPERMAFTWACT